MTPANGARGAGSAEPEPAAGDRPPGTLLERETELAVLRGLVNATRDGNGKLAAIEGSAGLGKTRLLAEVRGMAEELGFRVLRARGGELEREFAFGIVRQLFEPLLTTTPAPERADLFSGAAGLAAPLFGESGLVEAPAIGEASFAMLHGLYWLAANAAASRPTLLLVDDLHLADAPSLRWLDHMVRRLEGLPLAITVATRPVEQSEDGGLLTELLMDPAAVVLRPGPLRPESVPILAADLFLADPDPAFCAACHEATAGNPLYLRALLITLAVDGVQPTAESASVVREVGPEAIARIVSLRLARLPADAGALARAIAVLGRTADLGLAAALAGIERSAAHAASSELVRAELLRVEPALDFANPVVRTAVYESIGTVERAEAHRRAAALLTEAGAEPERAASHLLLVPPASDPLAVSALRDAARSALARGAAKEAVVYLRRALAEPPAGPRRGEVLGELGTVERTIDLPAAIEHLREAVTLIEEPRRFADVAIQGARALASSGLDNAEAIALYQATIDSALAQDRPKLVEVATAELINANWTEVAHYPQAKELIAGVDEERLAGGFASDFLLALLAHHEVRRGADRERAVLLARRALAGRSLENESTQGIYYALDALRAADELETALAGYASALAAARRRGDLLDVGGLLGFRGRLLQDHGDLRAAEPDVRESIAFSSEHGTQVHVMYSAVFLSDYLLEQGALDEAESVLGRAELGEHLPDTFHSVAFLGARGRLRLARRSPEAALRDFEAIGRIAEQVELSNPAEWPWRTGAATALLALGRGDEAHALAAEDLQLARRWGTPRPVGFALRTLGLIEGGDDGDRRLRESLEVLASSSARLEHARTLVELGSAVRRRNDRQEARELLQRGAELAARCGAAALAEQASIELAATGARPRKLPPTGVDALTVSERRVAQLAAEELTNKEIAQALFVTVKTVELHLSNVYRKLGIGSRKQLPAALVRLQEAPYGPAA
jgi:DNA-binding CsgD family transcriptional regulator